MSVEHGNADLREEIRELALNGAVTEALTLVEELKAEAEGWRRRNLILDAQMERQEAAISRLEAIAEAWEARLGVIADLDRIDVGLKKLNVAVLKEAVARRKEPRTSNKARNRGNGTINLRFVAGS